MADVQGAPEPDDTHCGANTSAGTPCRRPAGWATDHVGVGRCKWHGGRTRSHRQSAALVLETRRATSMLARLNEPQPIGHPVLALLDVAARVAEWERILRERLDELRTVEVTDAMGVERERAVVLLYERSLDRTARLLVDLNKLGLAARALALKEDTARRVVECAVTALDRIGLGEHEDRFREVFQAELRRAAGDAMGSV